MSARSCAMYRCCGLFSAANCAAWKSSHHAICSLWESCLKCGGGGFQGGWGRRSAGMLGKSAWDMFVSWL